MAGPRSSLLQPRRNLGATHSTSAHPSIPGSGNSEVEPGHSEHKQNLLLKPAGLSAPVLPGPPPRLAPRMPVGRLQPSRMEGFCAAPTFLLFSLCRQGELRRMGRGEQWKIPLGTSWEELFQQLLVSTRACQAPGSQVPHGLSPPAGFPSG